MVKRHNILWCIVCNMSFCKVKGLLNWDKTPWFLWFWSLLQWPIWGSWAIIVLWTFLVHNGVMHRWGCRRSPAMCVILRYFAFAKLGKWCLYSFQCEVCVWSLCITLSVNICKKDTTLLCWTVYNMSVVSN